MKIGIYGAGSIGCYVGGQLASAGAHVHFIGRERFRDSINKHGLNLSHYLRSAISVPTERFTFDLAPDALHDVDVILITVKSQDTHNAGKELALIANKNTLIISFQNGVSNADVLRKAMPDHNVLGAVVPFNVTSTGPGRFHSGTEGNLTIQSTRSNALTEMQSLFIKAGQGCELVDDIQSVQWGKLLTNLNNALNTLTGAPLKAGLKQKEYRKALAAMIEEALGIVKAASIKVTPFGKATPEKMIKVLRLPNFLYLLIMDRIIKIDDNARSSMLDDLEAGRESEIAYLQGEIVSLARTIGQAAPINQKVLSAVNEAFSNGASPKFDGDKLLEIVLSAKC